MKMNKRALHGALKTLNKVVDNKSAITALHNVKLAATHGTVTITATDLDQTLEFELPGEGELTICVPAKVLAELVKPENRKDDGDVTIEVLDENEIIVRMDGLRTHLTTFPVDDFPAVNDDEFKLVALWPTKPLAESLAFVLPAVSTDETRLHLCCLALTDDRVVATDGHRLQLSPAPTELPEPLLLPAPAAKVLQQIVKKADQVVIARTEDSVKMRVGTWTLTSKLVLAEFPPVDQVIPKFFDHEVTVDAQVFAKALKRLGALTSGPLAGVKMVVNGVIELSSSDPNVGEANVTVEPIENTHQGEDFVAGFASGYLIDALGKKKGEVTFKLGKTLDPLRVDHEGGRVAVVMPMRL
jgi:DNA polymerase-3 subunit beta